MKSDDDIIYPPPIPRIYRDHRKFIYQLTVSKTLTHPDKKEEKSNGLFNIEIYFLNEFSTKEEAEQF